MVTMTPRHGCDEMPGFNHNQSSPTHNIKI